MGENVNNFPKKLDMLNSIGLKATIDDLMMKESKFIPVADVCKEYTGKLNEGYREEELLESFISALAKVATNETSKHAVAKLSAIYESHKRDIDNVKALCDISRSNYNYVVPMIESAIVSYMVDKNATTREAARQSLYLFEGVPGLKTIAENLSFDEYEEKTNKKLINSRLNEAKLPQPKKTYTQEELDAIVEDAKASALNEAAAAKKEEVSFKSIDTHIDLSGTISKILEKESRNEGLKAFCEQYIAAKNSGKSDESLYESFISGISNWNYLNAVDTELSALNDRISKYKQEIDLKKILEVMSQTQSYYIVPLIEGVVVDYMNNKSMTNKAILKQRLEAFEYDPFVRDILNIVQRDFSIANTVYLGESVELLNSKVHTEKIYSPVLYIKENECVFNVKGTYYDRKGNTITKLTKTAVAALDESFKILCNVLNHPAVVFDEATDSIKIYDDKDIASVNESEILINGDSVTTQELENLASMSKLMNEHKEGFYAAINMINENYNKIAYIDFVKRVALNESNAKTVDVFRIKDNIFVNTTDNVLGKSIFYRNINPIQCRTYINEHMEINAAPLFEDILPNQETIQKDIDDTKKQYEDYISDLENKKSDLEKMKDTVDDDTLKDIEAAIKLIDDELNDVKDNYKNYQKESDEFTGIDADDDSEEPTEEPEETPETDDKPAEETPSDAEVSTPIEDTVEEPVATPYDALLDVPVSDDGYEIVKVSYQQNVKTGKKTGKGEVYLMIPSVDANGDVHNELKTVTFYLDPERNPILNNEYMPLAMYNAIKNAVVETPDTQTVELTSEEAENPSAEDLPMPVETVADETPIEDPVEDMYGLEDDPETIDNIAALTDEMPPADDTFDEGGFDSSFGPEIPDSPVDSSVLSDENDIDDADAPIDVPSAENGTSIENVHQEAPAETANKKVGPSYPITLGLSYDDISPIKSERFVESMERLGIEHSTPEGFGKSGCCLSIKNKADAYALRDYFKEWKNFDDNQFNKFFPELAECFGGPGSVATNESVKILGVQGVNNSVVLNENKRGIITLRIPASSKYLDAFGLSSDNKIDESVKNVVIKTTGFEESAAIYRKAKALCEAYDGNVTKSVKDFLKKYKTDFGKANVRTLTTDYSNLLESKISNAGIVTKVKDDKLVISLTEAEEPKLKKIFEGYYKESMPKEVSDFFQKSEESLKEGIKITIKDDKTGKTIELDTDDLDKTSSPDDGQAPADAVSDEYTTFTPDDSQLFAGNDSSDDSDDENKEDDKKKDSDEKKKNKSEETDDKSSDTEEEKPKKKLKFKVKKKLKKTSDEEEKTDESVKPEENAKALNESAEPNVLDWVICNNGAKCQIIAKMPNGEFILNDAGKTIQCPASYFKLAFPKADEVPVPFKYDKNTLKGLYEQMVRAGMFMNNNQITPNDCYVKYSEYKDAKDDDDIRLVIEGQTTYASKKYIRVLEDVNEFANPADYVDGVEVASDGSTLRQLKINKKDYETGVGSSAPVRVLVDCDSEDCKAVQLPKGSLLIKAMD